MLSKRVELVARWPCMAQLRKAMQVNESTRSIAGDGGGGNTFRSRGQVVGRIGRQLRKLVRNSVDQLNASSGRQLARFQKNIIIKRQDLVADCTSSSGIERRSHDIDSGQCSSSSATSSSVGSNPTSSSLSQSNASNNHLSTIFGHNKSQKYSLSKIAQRGDEFGVRMVAPPSVKMHNKQQQPIELPLYSPPSRHLLMNDFTDKVDDDNNNENFYGEAADEEDDDEDTQLSDVRNIVLERFADRSALRYHQHQREQQQHHFQQTTNNNNNCLSDRIWATSSNLNDENCNNQTRQRIKRLANVKRICRLLVNWILKPIRKLQNNNNNDDHSNERQTSSSKKCLGYLRFKRKARFRFLRRGVADLNQNIEIQTQLNSNNNHLTCDIDCLSETRDLHLAESDSKQQDDQNNHDQLSSSLINNNNREITINNDISNDHFILQINDDDYELNEQTNQQLSKQQTCAFRDIDHYLENKPNYSHENNSNNKQQQQQQQQLESTSSHIDSMAMATTTITNGNLNEDPKRSKLPRSKLMNFSQILMDDLNRFDEQQKPKKNERAANEQVKLSKQQSDNNDQSESPSSHYEPLSDSTTSQSDKSKTKVRRAKLSTGPIALDDDDDFEDDDDSENSQVSDDQDEDQENNDNQADNNNNESSFTGSSSSLNLSSSGLSEGTPISLSSVDLDRVSSSNCNDNIAQVQSDQHGRELTSDHAARFAISSSSFTSSCYHYDDLQNQNQHLRRTQNYQLPSSSHGIQFNGNNNGLPRSSTYQNGFYYDRETESQLQKQQQQQPQQNQHTNNCHIQPADYFSHQHDRHSSLPFNNNLMLDYKSQLTSTIPHNDNNQHGQFYNNSIWNDNFVQQQQQQQQQDYYPVAAAAENQASFRQQHQLFRSAHQLSFANSNNGFINQNNVIGSDLMQDTDAQLRRSSLACATINPNNNNNNNQRSYEVDNNDINRWINNDRIVPLINDDDDFARRVYRVAESINWPKKTQNKATSCSSTGHNQAIGKQPKSLLVNSQTSYDLRSLQFQATNNNESQLEKAMISNDNDNNANLQNYNNINNKVNNNNKPNGGRRASGSAVGSMKPPKLMVNNHSISHHKHHHHHHHNYHHHDSSGQQQHRSRSHQNELDSPVKYNLFSNQILFERIILQASTSELLQCLGEFMKSRCSHLNNFHSKIVIRWIEAVDRHLIAQGWQEISFINPANIVFVYLILRKTVDKQYFTNLYELQYLIMSSLYLSYAYMGNEISYPLHPFVVNLDNMSQFWNINMDIINRLSSDMLRINVEPTFFAEMFFELKRYQNVLIRLDNGVQIERPLGELIVGQKNNNNNETNNVNSNTNKNGFITQSTSSQRITLGSIANNNQNQHQKKRFKSDFHSIDQADLLSNQNQLISIDDNLCSTTTNTATKQARENRRVSQSRRSQPILGAF